MTLLYHSSLIVPKSVPMGNLGHFRIAGGWIGHNIEEQKCFKNEKPVLTKKKLI